MIIKMLLTNKDAIVRRLTADRAILFTTMIHKKYPLMKNCWGAMDDQKLTLQRPGNETQQKTSTMGWTHELY